MTKITMKDKIKKFTKDHKKTILTIVTLATTAAIVANEIDKANTKKALDYRDADNAWVTKENEWLDDEYSKGNKVYYLHDKTYVTMPMDTPTEWIKDRPKRP